MKKFLSLLLASVVAVLFLAVTPIDAYASSNDTDSKADNSNYVYPVVPGSKKWSEFANSDQKRAVCQIPDNILKNMSTEQLTDAVLDYPLYGDYIAFDSLDMGYKTLLDNFNGVRELNNRSDAGSYLVNQFKKTTLRKSSNALNDADQDFLKDGYIKMLLSQGDFQKSMTSNDINVINSYNSACSYKEDKISLTPETLKRNTATVKIPRGTNVAVIVRREQLSSSKKSEINQYFNSR